MPHSSRQLLSHLELASLNYQPDDPIHSTWAHKTRSFHEPHCPLSFSTWCMDPSPNSLQTPFREATTFRELPGKWMWQPWNYYLWSFSLSWKSFFGVLWDSCGRHGKGWIITERPIFERINQLAGEREKSQRGGPLFGQRFFCLHCRVGLAPAGQRVINWRGSNHYVW